MSLLLLAGILVVVAFGFLLARLSSRVPDVSDDGCAACGSTMRHALGPGAYRCAGCGYEGGPGWAALRDRRQMLRHAELDAGARTQAIFDDLSFARRQLLTATDRLEWIGVEWLEMGEELIAQHLDLPSAVEIPEVERPTLEALERIAEAQRALADARLKAASGPTIGPVAIEIPTVEWRDDSSSILLLRARRAHRAAHALLEQVDAVLGRHFPSNDEP